MEIMEVNLPSHWLTESRQLINFKARTHREPDDLEFLGRRALLNK